MKFLKYLGRGIDFKSVLASYIFHTVIVFGSLFFLADYLPKIQFEGFINRSILHSSFFLQNILTWDAHWFTHVAKVGYTEKTIVFFPLLITFIKIFSLTGIDTGLSGFILCNFFTFLSYLVLNKLCSLNFTKKETNRALMAYSVFPTSFFLNSIYSESLFLLLSLICIYCSRQNKYLLAGISGALATLTRNLGIVLFLVIVYEIWKDYKSNRKADYTMLSVFLLPMAWVTYMLFNLIMFNNPIAFINNQELWGRSFGQPFNNIWHAFVIFRWDLLNGFNPEFYGNNLSFILTVLAIIILLLVSLWPKLKLPKSYLIIGWLWLLIPLFSTAMPHQPLYSLSRFSLIIFPMYLFWGKINAPALYYCYIGLSSILLVLSVCLISNGWWIG